MRNPIINMYYTSAILMHILSLGSCSSHLVPIPECLWFEFVLAFLSPGNVFYLVVPKDQMGALTEESSTDEAREPSPPEAPETVSLSQETPRRSHPEASSNTTGLSQSRSGTQRHAIKNAEEIFQTMDGLMKKLYRLREIEADHYRLVKTEKKNSPLGQNSDDVNHTPASVVRMPSLDRGAGDGKEGDAMDAAQPVVQSTGF